MISVRVGHILLPILYVHHHALLVVVRGWGIFIVPDIVPAILPLLADSHAVLQVVGLLYKDSLARPAAHCVSVLLHITP